MGTTRGQDRFMKVVYLTMTFERRVCLGLEDVKR